MAPRRSCRAAGLARTAYLMRAVIGESSTICRHQRCEGRAWNCSSSQVKGKKRDILALTFFNTQQSTRHRQQSKQSTQHRQQSTQQSGHSKHHHIEGSLFSDSHGRLGPYHLKQDSLPGCSRAKWKSYSRNFLIHTSPSREALEEGCKGKDIVLTA